MPIDSTYIQLTIQELPDGSTDPVVSVVTVYDSNNIVTELTRFSGDSNYPHIPDVYYRPNVYYKELLWRFRTLHYDAVDMGMTVQNKLSFTQDPHTDGVLSALTITYRNIADVSLHTALLNKLHHYFTTTAVNDGMHSGGGIRGTMYALFPPLVYNPNRPLWYVIDIETLPDIDCHHTVYKNVEYTMD